VVKILTFEEFNDGYIMDWDFNAKKWIKIKKEMI